LRTDWWGKYTSGILIETYIRSMELFSIVLWSILHGEWRNITLGFSLDYLETYILLFVQLFIISHKHFLCSVNWKETFYLYFFNIEMIRYITANQPCYFLEESTGSNAIKFVLERKHGGK
jgi:hypothetical protein